MSHDPSSEGHLYQILLFNRKNKIQLELQSHHPHKNSTKGWKITSTLYTIFKPFTWYIISLNDLTITSSIFQELDFRKGGTLNFEYASLLPFIRRLALVLIHYLFFALTGLTYYYYSIPIVLIHIYLVSNCKNYCRNGIRFKQQQKSSF